MTRRGLVDLAVGTAPGLNAALFLDGAGPVVAVAAVLTAVAGVFWRRPYPAIALAAGAELVGHLALHPPPTNPWDAPLILVVAAGLGAFASWPFAVCGIAVLAGFVIASAALSGESPDPWSVLWSLAVTAGVALAARLVGRAARRARAEGQRRQELSSVPLEQAARDAVVEERTRLGADVHAIVRASVTAMRESATAAAAWDDHAATRLGEVQEEGRRAMVELRRLLGLLRDLPAEVPAGTSGQPAEVEIVPTPGRPSLAWRDVVVATALVALAVVEHSAFPPVGADSAGSLVLTVAAAGSVGLRGRAPGMGAAICGLGLLTSALSHHPVGQGFWWIGVLGGLTWSALARRRWREMAGAAVMVTGVAVLLAGYYRENLALSLLLLGAVGTAAVVRANRTELADAEAEHASKLSAEHAEAAALAVRAERFTIARELHDTVSHAVVVMVVQAGAAQALATLDRGAAHRCVDEIRSTAADALRDLDRLADVMDGTPGTASARSGDVRALVGRMRAGGLAAELTEDDAADERDPTVYRVVQEALTNALRYAPTAQVRVTLSASGGARVVEVVDDGPGPADAARRGYGLIGMLERVERLGGTFESGPGPSGRGFRVRALVPIPTQAGSVSARSELASPAVANERQAP